ncbi:hypothetical protein D9758_000635 [Tetrapyrgos nigripes]|uniref:Beta-xylanase n=1 Tax=Tetrapyrgos nigripes TaxID=182062 RepID=A0A8H5GZA6_9AGAR|nr:hypothetical protein D9758_000635 [Tetrapyrgos nigripes]
MLRLSVSLASLLPFILTVTAQSPTWGQCGGIGWTGATACVSGSACQVVNPYYSQCIPGAATGGASTTPSSPAPTSTSTAKLNTVAKAAGKLYFGSATDNPELSDTAYVSILSDSTTFGQITPGNSMKWDATEPSRGTFTFTNGDTIANLAKQNGQLLRGHNCVWKVDLFVKLWRYLISFFSLGIINSQAGFPLETSIMRHFPAFSRTTAAQWWATTKDKFVDSWDVVNEPFNDDGTVRQFVMSQTIGIGYVDVALKAARAADPNAKLYINDYNIEGPGAKSTAMLNLVTDLKARGIPIDGVGIQGHLIVGALPGDIQQNLEAFTALGVEVAITELDIRMTLPATPALLAQQQKDYQTVISACNAVPKCVGVTIWDYTDKYSWIPGVFSGQGAALPWDQNLVKKPAYDGIVAGFQ